MDPNAAVGALLQNGKIPADHRDLPGVQLSPVHELGRFPGAAGRGEDPGAITPQKGHRMKDAAAIPQQMIAGRRDQGLVLGVIFRVALRQMRQRPRDLLRRGLDIIGLALDGSELEFEVPAGLRVQKGIAHRMPGVHRLVDLFHAFPHDEK